LAELVRVETKDDVPAWKNLELAHRHRAGPIAASLCVEIDLAFFSVGIEAILARHHHAAADVDAIAPAVTGVDPGLLSCVAAEGRWIRTNGWNTPARFPLNAPDVDNGR